MLSLIALVWLLSILRDKPILALDFLSSSSPLSPGIPKAKLKQTVFDSISSETDEQNEHYVRTNLLPSEGSTKGHIAICAAVYQEGRFITEWLLYVSVEVALAVVLVFHFQSFYFWRDRDWHANAFHLHGQHRLMGVDTFYLYVLIVLS